MREVTLYEVTERQVLCEVDYFSFEFEAERRFKDTQFTRVKGHPDYLFTKVDQPVQRVRFPPSDKDFYFAVHPKIEEIISCKYKEEIKELEIALDSIERRLAKVKIKLKIPQSSA